MSLENITYDAIAHFGTGVLFSVGDYFTWRWSNPKQQRVDQKTETLEAMSMVLKNAEAAGKTETAYVPAESAQYAINVGMVQEYLLTQGLMKKELPFIERMRYKVKSIIHEEKLNNLSLGKKALFATAIEVGYDSILGFSYYTHIRQQSPIADLVNNIYQIPAFIAGMIAGKGVRNVIHYCSVWGEEAKLDKTLKEMVRKTNVVDLVIAYEPPSDVQQVLQEKHDVRWLPATLTGAGERWYRKLGTTADQIALRAKAAGESMHNAADAITHYSERKAADEAALKNGKCYHLTDKRSMFLS